jgi:hypothetical protein
MRWDTSERSISTIPPRRSLDGRLNRIAVTNPAHSVAGMPDVASARR